MSQTDYSPAALPAHLAQILADAFEGTEPLRAMLATTLQQVAKSIEDLQRGINSLASSEDVPVTPVTAARLRARAGHSGVVGFDVMTRLATQSGMPITMALADAVLRIGLEAGLSVDQADMTGFDDSISKSWVVTFDRRLVATKHAVEFADLVDAVAHAALAEAQRLAQKMLATKPVTGAQLFG